MALAEQYKLVFSVNTQGVDQLNSLERSIAGIDKGGKSAATSLTGLETSLAGGARSAVGMGAAVGVLTGAIASASVAAFVLAKSTAQLAQEQANVAARTGLTVREVGQFTQIAQNANVNVGALVTGFSALSRALTDNTEHGKRAKDIMRQFGVELTNVYGAALPTRELLIRIGEAAGRIEEPTKKSALAVKLLGESGSQLLPILNSNIRTTLQEMERLGVGFDERGAVTAKKFNDEVNRLNTNLDVLKQRVGLAVAELLNPVLRLLLAQPQTNARGQIVAPQLSQPNYGPRSSFADDIELLTGRAPGGVPSFDANAQAADLAGRQARVRQLLTAGGSSTENLARQLEFAQRELNQAIQDANIALVIKGLAAVQAIKERQRRLAAEPPRFDRPDFNAISSGFTRTGTLGFQEAQRVLGFGISQFTGQVPSAGFGGIFTAESTIPPTSQTPQFIASQAKAALESLKEREQFAETARNRELQFRTRLIELMAGPGGEFQAAQAIAKLRIDSARTVAEVQEAQNELTIRALEIQKQRQQELRQVAGSVFDAITARGGAGLIDFARGQALVIQRTIFQNLTSEVLGGSAGKLSLPGQQNADKSLNLFGRLLQGTPFGVDPLKGATDLNTLATTTNTNALLSLSASMTGVATAGGGVGGGLSSLLAAAGIPAGVFQGAGRNPFIFSSRGGTSSSVAEDEELFSVLATDPGAHRTTLGKAAAYGAAVAAGATGVVSGIRQGGGPGTANAIAAGLGTAAALDPEPVSKAILAIASLAASLVGGILPDPKKARSQELDRLIRDASFTTQAPTEFNIDTEGRTFDFDSRGNRRFYQVNLTVNALDAQSVMNRSGDIADAVAFAMRNGHSINRTAQEVVLAQ